MTQRPKFQPHEYNLTWRDRRRIKKMALSGVYGVHTMDTVELLHSMNGYKTWRKEYLKKVMREQRALDS